LLENDVAIKLAKNKIKRSEKKLLKLKEKEQEMKEEL
jgi:hypothetical protein